MWISTYLALSFCGFFICGGRVGVWEVCKQHSVLEVCEMGVAKRETGLYVHLFCFRPASLKFTETGISFSLVVFLVHCDQEFYFIIIMYTVSSMLRLWYIIASCVNSAGYTEITVRLVLMIGFCYGLLISTQLILNNPKVSILWLIDEQVCRPFSFPTLLNHKSKYLCAWDPSSLFLLCIEKGAVHVIDGWDIHDTIFLEVPPPFSGKALVC